MTRIALTILALTSTLLEAQEPPARTTRADVDTEVWEYATVEHSLTWKHLNFYGPNGEFVQVTWAHADSALAFLRRIAGPSGPAKWSYNDIGLYNAVANTLGRQGWELLSMAFLLPDGTPKSPTADLDYETRPTVVMTFKRRRTR